MMQNEVIFVSVKSIAPVDTERKLNVQDVSWTSYVRSIYVLCLLGSKIPLPNILDTGNTDERFLQTLLKKSTNMHENPTHSSSEPQLEYNQTYYKNLEQL